MSKPRGHKSGVLQYKQSHQGHLKTKKSRRAKRRMLDSKEVDKTIKKRLIKKIVNI